MNIKDSFLKIKVTSKTSKYIFKIGDHDVEITKDYTVVMNSDICDEKCIVFKNIEQVHKFQKEIGINKFIPCYYNCYDCDHHTDRKSNYDDHIESNRCRKKRGLDPLEQSVKVRYGRKNNKSYHCDCCDYTPKAKASRASMKIHMKTKKHITNCKLLNVNIEDCLTPIVE